MSKVIHRRAMSLLLEQDPFRYMMQGGVMLILSAVLTVLAYADFHPIGAYRAELFEAPQDGDAARQVLRIFLSVSFKVVPVLCWIVTGAALTSGYMAARKLAMMPADELRDRRQTYAWLDGLVEEERRGKLALPILVAVLFVSGAVRLSLFYVPLDEGWRTGIAFLSSFVTGVAFFALPFAALSGGAYYEEKLRERLRTWISGRTRTLAD